ncbi:MAG TPA: hypothetical protein VGL09_07935 [Methylomirabilota bacterium]
MISTKSGVLGFIMIVIVAMSALGCASSDTTKAMGPNDMPAVAGKWVGNITTPGGTTTPGTLDISPSGDYVVQAGGFGATGKAQIKDGDIVFTPNYSSGGTGVGMSRRSSSASVSQRPDGSLVMTGFGHSDAGPFNFMATKQK